MGARGPAPEPGARRRNIVDKGWRVIDSKPCTKRVPKFPLGPPVAVDSATVYAAEKDRWATLWKLPQAIIWHEQSCGLIVARYCRVVVMVEAGCDAMGRAIPAQYHGIASKAENELLLTPAALARAHIIIGEQTAATGGPTGTKPIGQHGPADVAKLYAV